MDKVEFARKLRREQTPEEAVVWGILHGRRFHGFKFRRQVPVDAYFADFLSEEGSLIVEIDGDHHLEQMAKDDARTAVLRDHGYSIVRLSNHEVRTDIAAVRAEIASGLGILGDTL